MAAGSSSTGSKTGGGITKPLTDVGKKPTSKNIVWGVRQATTPPIGKGGRGK